MTQAELTGDSSGALAVESFGSGTSRLDAIATLRSLLEHGPTVIAAIPPLGGMEPAETQAVTSQLNKLAQECGCHAGGVGTAIAAGLTFLAALAGAVSWLAAVPLIIVAAFLGGFVGKRSGRAFAHWRWRRALSRLIARRALGPEPL